MSAGQIDTTVAFTPASLAQGKVYLFLRRSGFRLILAAFLLTAGVALLTSIHRLTSLILLFLGVLGVLLLVYAVLMFISVAGMDRAFSGKRFPLQINADDLTLYTDEHRELTRLPWDKVNAFVFNGNTFYLDMGSLPRPPSPALRTLLLILPGERLSQEERAALLEWARQHGKFRG